MLTHPTIEKLHALRLPAMAQAFDQQRGSSQHAELSFEDRFGLLVDRRDWRVERRRRRARAAVRLPSSPASTPGLTGA